MGSQLISCIHNTVPRSDTSTSKPFTVMKILRSARCFKTYPCVHQDNIKPVINMDLGTLESSVKLRSLSCFGNFISKPVRSLFALCACMHAGQVELQAPKWLDIVKISYQAWIELEPRIFQAAWISCGYVQWNEFPNPVDIPVEIEDARKALDVFGNLGGGTPQRCRVFEWQIQDYLTYHRPVVQVHVSSVQHRPPIIKLNASESLTIMLKSNIEKNRANFLEGR